MTSFLHHEPSDHQSDDSSKTVCPVVSLAENATEPLFGNTTFYEFNKILSGASAAFVVVVVSFLLVMHATHASKPNEQSKIMKIALFFPVLAILSFLAIAFPTAAVYINPWAVFVEAIALGAFFLLLCEFISPSSHQRDVFFAALPTTSESGKNGKNGLEWFRLQWILIFQFPVVTFLVAIFTDITEAAGAYCQFMSSTHFAKLWLSVATYVSTGVAVIAIFRFYGRLKQRLAPYGALKKLLAFKIVVFLTTFEGVIFTILESAGKLEPTSVLTRADLIYGIPKLLTCLELVPLSLFLIYAYSYRPYLLKDVRRREESAEYTASYSGGLSMLITMWSPVETIRAIGFAFTMNKERNQRLSGPHSSTAYDAQTYSAYTPLAPQTYGGWGQT
ncbi:organic solute transporter Ostalpha-domain-containing protein [Astrocystis sublimbata]|nr:organic solute transporter Ostalpha-domain-containing protein [Astrocystis sublimbata]